MHARVVALVAAAIAMAAAGACVFDDGAHGTILCASNEECPSAQRCDVVHHVCAAAGAPRATAARFDPIAASAGTVRLVVDASAPVAATPPPKPTFDGADPGFTLESGAGTAEVTLAADVSALAEGFYPLTSIALADQNGDVAVSDVKAVLEIDRTAPVIGVVDVAGGLAGVFSDADGSNSITVRFAVSEVPASVDVRASGLQLACAAGVDALHEVCTGTFTKDAIDASGELVVTVADAAGNTATAQEPLAVDVAPPFVVAGSVHVDVDGKAIDGAPGRTVHLDMLVSEPLGEDPVVTIASPQQIELETVSHEGQFYALAGVIDVVDQAGTFPLTASLVDVFGHAANAAPVPLPDPYAAGFPLDAVAESPCQNAPICPDVDGDGFVGITPSCPPSAFSDCDDTDAAVHPGAPEIAGDGVGNGCVAAIDGALDGIFVDAAGGSDANDGTSVASRTQTLTRGLALAVAAHKPVFVAAGSYDVSTVTTIQSPIVCFTDAAFVTAGGACDLAQATSSTLAIENGDGPFAIAHVRFHLPVDANAAVEFVDVDVDGGLFVESSVAFIGGHIQNGVLVNVGAGGTRFLRTSIGNGIVMRADTFMDGVTSDGVGLWQVETGVALTAVNSAFFAESEPTPVVQCDGCRSLRLENSNLVSLTSHLIDVNVALPAPAIYLAGNVFDAPPGAAMLTVTPGPSGEHAQVALFSNVIGFANGALFFEAPSTSLANDFDGVNALNQCAFAGCQFAFANVAGPAPVQADNLHIAGDPASSEARGHGITAPQVPIQGVDPAAVADVDGDCRYEPGLAPNAGADQTP